MKEIKAYVRCKKAETVVEALEGIGITDMTVIDVMGIGELADPQKARYSVECVEKYSKLAKIEVVCRDQDTDRVVKTIRQAAYTGLPGDGIIFVSPVEKAVKIRNGLTGDQALL